jgi:hypothetical protein
MRDLGMAFQHAGELPHGRGFERHRASGALDVAVCRRETALAAGFVVLMIKQDGE